MQRCKTVEKRGRKGSRDEEYMITIKKRGLENSPLYYWLIVLFCMNFLGRGSIVCTVFAIFTLFKLPRKTTLDMGAVFTLLLSVAAFFSSMVHYDMIEAIKSLNFFLLYYIGLNGYYASSDRAAFLKKTIFAIFVGYAFLVLLTLIVNLNGVRASGNRLIINNVWTGETIATTLVGLMSSVVIGYFFYALVCQKKKGTKVCAIAALVVVLVLNAATATRTPFFLLAINLLVMSGLYLLNQRGRNAIRVLAILLAVIVIAAILIAADAFGIRSAIEESPIFLRLLESGTNTSRGEIMKNHFRYMLDYPWGGYQIAEAVGRQAHNFLQQGYDYYGVFATVPLLIIGISFLRNMAVLAGTKRKIGIDYLLFSMYLTMLIQACLEPVFTGYPCFMFSFLLIHGMANAYLKTRSGELGENRADQYGPLRKHGADHAADGPAGQNVGA